MAPLSTTEASASEDRYHHGDLRQGLIAAALSLLTEEQDWGFSLREVARRAGVSHNAPYNHFPSKQDLLAAVAAAGYDLLRARMLAAQAQAATSEAALKAVGVAYVRFGAENPAHYRLMFGSAFAPGKSGPPPLLCAAAAAAKGLLRDIIRKGAENGSFAVAATDAEALDMAVLSAWSLVHGLTMLLLDGLAGPETDAEPSTAAKPATTAKPATAAEVIAGQVAQCLLEGIRRSP